MRFGRNARSKKVDYSSKLLLGIKDSSLLVNYTYSVDTNYGGSLREPRVSHTWMSQTLSSLSSMESKNN